jgi:hypothetical protein
MIKKLTSALITCALVFALATAVPVIADENDFVINEDGILVEYNGSGGDVVIPDGVTSVGWHVFRDNATLTSVTIPDSVINIYSFAFADCTNLKSVSIGNSVELIGWAAFAGCTSLTNIIIPAGVLSIWEYAFVSTGLETIMFKSPTPPIFLYDHAIGKPWESGVFDDSDSLTAIYVPEGAKAAYEAATYPGGFLKVFDKYNIVEFCTLCVKLDCTCIDVYMPDNSISVKITGGAKIIFNGGEEIITQANKNKLTIKITQINAPDNTEAFFTALKEYLLQE